MGMNRSGFVGAALAGLGSFLLPRKTEAACSDDFKFGDCVDLEVAVSWATNTKGTYKGYVVYVDAEHEKDTIIITKEIPVEKVIHDTTPPSVMDKIWEDFKFQFVLSVIVIAILMGFVIRLARKR